MIPYSPPLADIRFILTRLIGLERIAALPGYDSVNEELVDAILGAAGQLASEVFAPLNDSGDKEGAHFINGKVTTPKGFREAYQAHVEGGWNALPTEAEWGGQDLPWSLAMPVQEMWQGSNMSLALCTLLNQGAIELLAAHGDAALKAKYLPKMVSGVWSGTMNITEPQAGSDVGAISSRAVREGDHFLVTGQKIFISFGDHDMVDNIIHFVLARLPNAPEGTRGLSLFLVPKIMVNDDGSLGAPNDVRVVSIEHKLGQHAGPTCVMAFGDNGGATGYLVGAENGGIAAMFVMMNKARIGVGIQGLGLMERAYQQARDYAKTRVQSPDIAKPKDPPGLIIRHPDVRRMLLQMRSATEAARAIALNCAFALDGAKRAADETEKQAAAARVDLLTPVVKAWFTDLCNEMTSVGVQVYGGMGYIEEAGAAQHMRDARVLSIYEGTNGIQANDLVFRKLARDDGAAFSVLLKEIDAFLSESSAGEGVFVGMRRNLTTSLAQIREASAWIIQQAKTNPANAAAVSTSFLRLTGNTIGGFYLIRSAWLAKQDLAAGVGEPEFLKAKIITAQFFASQILPQNLGLAAIVMGGGEAVLAMPEDAF